MLRITNHLGNTNQNHNEIPLFGHCCSVAKSCLPLCDPMNCSTPGFPVLNYLPICSNSYPLNRLCYLNISTSSTPFSSCPQSFLASESFSIELALHIRWPKYWSFSNSISPSNEYSGLVSFRIDLFDLLAEKQTLKSLL